MTRYDKYLNELSELARASSSNTSCKKLKRILTNLGFEIKSCGSAGHKIACHPAIPLDESVNFNCGHNEGDSIKPFYIKKLHKIVEQYEDLIKESLQ